MARAGQSPAPRPDAGSHQAGPAGGRMDCPPLRDPSSATPPGVIALHPEATDDPATLRWVVSHHILPFAGTLASAPGLDDLLADRVSRVVVGPDTLLVTLAPGSDWAELGPVVRRALMRALGHTDAWVGAADARVLSGDDALGVCADELIEGPIGDIARAHGGHIALAGVQDGVVTVKMAGACRGCPAAVITMHQRLEHQLRRRVPGLVDVRSING